MQRRECICINNKEQEGSDCNTYLFSCSIIPTAPRNTVKPFAHPQSVCSPHPSFLNNTTHPLPHMDTSHNWVEQIRAFQ